MTDEGVRVKVEDLEMVRLGPKESGLAVDILIEVSDWVKVAKNLDQWQPGPALNQTMREAAERGDLWLAKLDGQPVGTLILQWQDEFFWGEQPDDAGYVHKLATRRSVAGRGVGSAMLNWAEQQVAQAGRPYVRLDTQADNPALNAYYQAAGYTLKGVVTPSNWRASLYEKAV